MIRKVAFLLPEKSLETVIVADFLGGGTQITERKDLTMTKEQKYAILENRLNQLENRIEKDNHGVCRRIRREMRNLKASKGTEE